ncbi:Cd(II)/Pb(II)-responsive transcriptional regulator [Roseateles sp. GG27B]
MKIGELASSTATQVETIRFYEREGLIPEPNRTASNYRSYDASHVERLTFIRRCRSLDMALEEIRALLRFKDAPSGDCGDVNALLDAHIQHVAARLLELHALEQELTALRARCQSPDSGAQCEILKELAHAQPGTTRHRAPHTPVHVGVVHGPRSPAPQR